MKTSIPAERLPQLLETFQQIRSLSEKICQPLSAEDALLQAMPDVSPPKWHLAHTTWFFERFLLRAGANSPSICDPAYDHLFNSYYESAGSFHPRAQRGLLSRPSLAEIMAYRHEVDARVLAREWKPQDSHILEIGLHHEQQHQELLLTDIKYNFFSQPLQPAYGASRSATTPRQTPPLSWEALPEGVHRVGESGDTFTFDNERPEHSVYIQPAFMAKRPSTNGEYLEFMQAGAYERSELWLSEGWQWILAQRIKAPLYWKQDADAGWRQFTLHGWENLQPDEPVYHLSYFEADAFARWSGARLPSEQEWEVFARRKPMSGHFLDLAKLHPERTLNGREQVYGDVWEWTSSSYAPYPGYKPWMGSLGEYNGKFMVNQYVLRGGSCASPPQHIRPSYRNFFPATARWQFTGVRLAKDDL